MGSSGAVSVAVGGRDARTARHCWKVTSLLDGRPGWSLSDGHVARAWAFPEHDAELAVHASYFTEPEMSGWVFGLTFSPDEPKRRLVRARWFRDLRERLGDRYRLDAGHRVRLTGILRRPPFLDAFEHLCTAVEGPRALGIRKRQWSDTRPRAAFGAMDAARWRVMSMGHRREAPPGPGAGTLISMSTTETGTLTMFHMPPQTKLPAKLREALAEVRRQLRKAGYEEPHETVCMRHHTTTSITVARRELAQLERLQDALAASR